MDGGPWQPYTAPFVISSGGAHVVQYRSTDQVGVAEATKTLNVYVYPQASGQVGGTVPATLSLTLGQPATFGAFTPGVTKDYSASTTANVISTAGDALAERVRPEPDGHRAPRQRRVLAAVRAAGARDQAGHDRHRVQRRRFRPRC